MNPETMFFITTFEKLEFDESYGWWRFGDKRTPVFYTDLETARDVVVSNAMDMYETIYEYVVIEEIEVGRFYPECVSKELYKVKNADKYIDTTYERIELPDNFPEYFSIVIG
ncbi:MAG: hypothetical protein M0P99_06890 [Candidatus Cloacimonetes bacterium]|nr:hypothetical protein [Candidatus Cloacimonadota bacterium]